MSGIARHSHPGHVHLLFAFDYTLAIKRSRVRETTPPVGSADAAIPTFLTARDWQRELQRLGVTNDQWRVTEANKKFLVCSRCGELFYYQLASGHVYGIIIHVHVLYSTFLASSFNVQSISDMLLKV